MLVGHCERCVDENRRLGRIRSLVRQPLLHGPEGAHLCREHHHEAWEEWAARHGYVDGGEV